MTKHKPELGTVIQATMRSEDLIPAFLDELEYYNKPEYDSITEEFIELGWPEQQQQLVVSTAIAHSEMGGHLLEALFDALCDIAPDGSYFGAHPGDGCNFGWWPFEDYD